MPIWFRNQLTCESPGGWTGTVTDSQKASSEQLNLGQSRWRKKRPQQQQRWKSHSKMCHFIFVLHVPGVNASPARTKPQKKYLMYPNSWVSKEGKNVKKREKREIKKSLLYLLCCSSFPPLKPQRQQITQPPGLGTAAINLPLASSGKLTSKPPAKKYIISTFSWTSFKYKYIIYLY